MPEMSLAREQRRYEVYTCVSGAGEAGASVQDVAKCLKMTVSPHLRELLDQLVTDGFLVKRAGLIMTGRGLRDGWKYFAVPQEQS